VSVLIILFLPYGPSGLVHGAMVFRYWITVLTPKGKFQSVTEVTKRVTKRERVREYF
jgi:hypothetical protein